MEISLEKSENIAVGDIVYCETYDKTCIVAECASNYVKEITGSVELTFPILLVSLEDGKDINAFADIKSLNESGLELIAKNRDTILSFK